VVLSTGSGISGPSFSTIVSRRAPANMQGGALGTQQSLGALARVFGPTWGGFVYGVGFRLPFITAAIGLGLGYLLSMRITNKRS
jgi:MFS transporter, DHA1 family, tetracycline resistance protein